MGGGLACYVSKVGENRGGFAPMSNVPEGGVGSQKQTPVFEVQLLPAIQKWSAMILALHKQITFRPSRDHNFFHLLREVVRFSLPPELLPSANPASFRIPASPSLIVC